MPGCADADRSIRGGRDEVGLCQTRPVVATEPVTAEEIGAAAMRQGGDKKQALRHGNNGSDKLDKFATFLEPQDAEELSAAKLMMVQAG